MSVVDKNDQRVGELLLELYLRGPGECLGITLNYDQAITLFSLMKPEALPRVPVLRILFALSQIDQLIPPKLDGSRGYGLVVGWNQEKLFWLDVTGLSHPPGEIDKLELLGKIARTSDTFFPDEGARFCWF